MVDILDYSAVVAASFFGRVVENSGTVAVFGLATFGYVDAAATTWAMFGWVRLWIPHCTAIVGRPEHVILAVEDVSLGDVFPGTHGVALAQVAFAAVTLV